MRASARLGSRRTASAYSAIASSIRPWFPSVVPRLLCALAKFGLGPIEFSLQKVVYSERVVSFGKIGFAAEHYGQMIGGFAERRMILDQKGGQTIPRPDILRLDTRRLREMENRFVQIVLILHSDAQIEVCELVFGGHIQGVRP